MNWIERLQNALDYIETSLERELTPALIAEQAFTTAFHFQRMFSVITGITLAEYIRKRRLTLAAQELVSGKASIADAAPKWNCIRMQTAWKSGSR
ncbi:MAG: helix-turn-helix transcriptional regulator [Spirochaetales bacterium]|nr:helix-turn-helix transcriptional regulator [Spirochaetales bacterium]